MLKYYILLVLLVPYAIFSQRTLQPSVHLRPFEELPMATVSALAEDALGQIWIGTQSGLCYWDGIRIRTISGSNSMVTQLSVKDSCVFAIQPNGVQKINSWTEKVSNYKLPNTDFQLCNFLKDGMLFVSNNQKDTTFLDYNLKRQPNPKKNSVNQESCQLGDYFIQIKYHPNQGTIVGKTTEPISKTYCSQLVKYNERTVFAATHEGLIELALNREGKIERIVHFKSSRVDRLLVDRNKNLWVGTAENGLFQIHANMIENRYYPQFLDDGLVNPCWTFAELDGELYNCTSNGLVAFLNQSKTRPIIEQLTKGMMCFTALETPHGIFVGTGESGLFRITQNKLERVHYNEKNILDNTILQLIREKDALVFCTKSGVYRMDFDGKIMNTQKEGASYVMQMNPNGEGYVAATTKGLLFYDHNFRVVKKVQTPTGGVFSDLTKFKNEWWCTTMSNGIYRFDGDSLRHVRAPYNQLLMVENFRNDLWFTGFKGAMQYRNGAFASFTLENGFPLAEYAQGALFNQRDSTIYFGGVQGIFAYSGTRKETHLALPMWHISQNGKCLSDGSKIQLDYDQAVVQLLPRAIITSDQNRFELQYFNGKNWCKLENGAPLLLELDYGKTTVSFKIKNTLSGKQRFTTIYFERNIPVWMKIWFKLLLVIAALLIIIGSYFLWKYLKTRKRLQIETEERKLSEERLRISRELHDNIGARLSHIISSLDIQLFKNEGTDELATINAFAKETMRQLRETIWAVSDKTIFFSELKQRIEHYVIQTNGISTVNIEFQDKSAADFELNATETINLFRITQEAINNALKYSSSKNVRVAIDETYNSVELSISDDGVGLNVEEAKRKGSGISGMISRAMEMHAQFEITSNAGKGTVIKVVILKR